MTGPRNCTPRGGCHVPRRAKLVTSRRGYRCRLRHLESCRCSAPPRSAREQGHLPGVSLSSTWLWPLMAGQSGQTRDRSSRPGRGDAPELASQEPVLCSGVAVVVALGGRAFSLALQEACLGCCLASCPLSARSRRGPAQAPLHPRRAPASAACSAGEVHQRLRRSEGGPACWGPGRRCRHRPRLGLRMGPPRLQGRAPGPILPSSAACTPAALLGFWSESF